MNNPILGAEGLIADEWKFESFTIYKLLDPKKFPNPSVTVDFSYYRTEFVFSIYAVSYGFSFSPFDL